jgi:uncharacterized protein YbjQ (UPF0145 family)
VKDVEQARRTTDIHLIRELATSLSPSVRLAIAENPATPQDVLAGLARASEMDVRLAASARLEQHFVDEISSERAEQFPVSEPRRTSIYLSTLTGPPDIEVEKTLGIVFGSSSRIAWGFNKQADRLSAAMEAAIFDLEDQVLARGGNAAIGVSFALNSSTGGASNILGASEGVMVLGTAVLSRAAS